MQQDMIVILDLGSHEKHNGGSRRKGTGCLQRDQTP